MGGMSIGRVRVTCLVGHDADSRRILVDEDMIRPAVRAGTEDVGGVTGRNGHRLEAWHDGRFEPLREHGVEELVTHEVGRPRLQTPMCEMLPPRFRSRGDLCDSQR